MRPRTGPLLGALVACAAGQAAVQSSIYPQWRENYAPETGDYSQLSPDQMLFALAGFRELIAGILWVRADTYFSEGNFDAILPLIRIVTYLDPKQIDVYATGMWHIAYNFTDEGSRSDRRYIPTALALGKEGAEKNSHTYELFFENGWLYYHKIDDDYPQSVKWLQQAIERPDMLPARRNLLSNAFQRAGQVDKAADYSYSLLERAEKVFKDTGDYQARTNRDTVEQNFDNLLVRMAQRGWLATEGGYFDQGQYDTKPPFDVGFSVSLTVIDPKVIQVEGTWNVLPVGTRVRIVLRDADYPNAAPGGMKWDQGTAVELTPQRDLTFMQDQLFVRNQRFRRKIDMSRDVTMYPFISEKYIVEFYYNPRSAPSYIQDKLGWSGEGMTDQSYLNTEIREGQRVVFAQFEMTRDQLLRRGQWQSAVPVIKTPNYRGTQLVGTEAEIVRVPGLRSEP